MNRKRRKLLFIRSKNYMVLKGYKLPKWRLLNKYWPTRWKNLSAGILEESWVIDMATHEKY